MAGKIPATGRAQNGVDNETTYSPNCSSTALSVAASSEVTFLFGGNSPWIASDWTASDDRVRGGKSVSHLKIISAAAARSCSSPVSEQSQAHFYGNLDPSVLGAGFASQRTCGVEDWDLSTFDGVRICVAEADDKTYTFVLKDEIREKRPDGREQSSTSFEYEFKGSGTVLIPWNKFVPTYRGRKVEGKKLNSSSIKRVHIMIRSFFGGQEGDFSLTLESISAVNFEHDEKGAAFTEVNEKKAIIKRQPSGWCRGCTIL